MSTTFALHRPLTASGAVSHAIHAHLQSANQLNLLLARTNTLELYSITPNAIHTQTPLKPRVDANNGSSAADADPSFAHTTSEPTLLRAWSKPLFGKVEGMSVVRLPGWNRDAILLCFPCAKLCLVAWDPLQYDLVTLAIWSQDEDVVEKERERERAHAPQSTEPAQPPIPLPFVQSVKKYLPPMLRVDPAGRCAALASFDCFLNVFDMANNGAEAAVAGSQAHNKTESNMNMNGTGLPAPGSCMSGVSTSATGVSSFYAIATGSLASSEGVGSIPSLQSPATYSLASLRLGFITDMQFLDGFEDPTLLVLHEPQRTWEGRYASKRTTQELTAITFHMRQQSFSIIGLLSGVSHDTFSILPIPRPLGGALLLSQSAIWHWNNNQIDYGLAVNEFARNDKLTQMENSPHVLALDLSHAAFLSTHPNRATLFLATKTGDAYLLHLHPSGSTMRTMQLEPLGVLPIPQGCVRIPNPAAVSSILPYADDDHPTNLHAAQLPSFLFCYSRIGPSVLIEYRRATFDEKETLMQWEREEREEERIAQEEQSSKVQQTSSKRESDATLPSPSDTAIPLPGMKNEDAGGKSDASTANGPIDNHEVNEPPTKRSRLEELYKEMTGEEMAEDELMDVFGFGDSTQQESEKASAKPSLLAPQDEKQAAEEARLAEAAKDKDVSRRAAWLRQARAPKDLMFFLRDRLMSSAPLSDALIGYAAPALRPTPEEEEAREAADLQEAIEEQRRRNEMAAAKPTDEAAQRAAEEKEQEEMNALEKTWREKEKRSRVLEIVQISGHGDSGAITISNEAILPDILSAQPLHHKCIGCWNVKQPSIGVAQRNASGAVSPQYDSFLLIATPIATRVWTTGAEEVKPLEEGEHPFNLSRTIHVANVQLQRDARVTSAEATKKRKERSDEYVEAIAQVYQTGVRLLQQRSTSTAAASAWHSLDVTLSPSLIDAAYISSPYVLLRLNDGSVRLFELSVSGTGRVQLGDARIPALHPSQADKPITAAYLYKDETSHRTMKRPTSKAKEADGMDIDGQLSTSEPSAPTSQSASADDVGEMDELERMLAGGDTASQATAPVPTPAPSTSAVATPIAIPPDHYLVVARGSSVEFYMLPSYELIHSIARLPDGRRILNHTPLPHDADADADGMDGSDGASLNAAHLPPIVDLYVDAVSSSPMHMPVMLAFLANGDLLAYRPFLASIGGAEQLRWARSDIPFLTRPFMRNQTGVGSVAIDHTKTGQDADALYRDAYGTSKRSNPSSSMPSRFQRLIHPGADSRAMNGVLVTGTKAMLLCAERDDLRAYPVAVEWKPRSDDDSSYTASGVAQLEEEEDVESDESSGEGTELATEEESEELNPSAKRKIGLVCATPFHHVDCPFGWIYFDTHSTLNICQLPPRHRLPSHPLFLSQKRMQQYGLLSPVQNDLSSTSPLASSISLSPSCLDCDSTAFVQRTLHLGVTPRFVQRHIPTGTYAVVVSRPVRLPSAEMESERTVPVYEDRYELLILDSNLDIVARHADFEPHEVVLSMCCVRMNKRMYVALGTSSYQGEDHAGRGRIILIDLWYGIGGTTQGKLLKLKVYSQAEKLPVQHVAPISNLLCSCQGSRIILYKHTEKQLHGCGFIDCNFYITSVSCINNYILYGDVRKGLHLVYWDPTLKSMSHLGQSAESFHAIACDFLVDHRALNLTVADEQGNVQIFRFQPNTVGAAASKLQMAAYENPQLTLHPAGSQTLKESAYTGTSMIGGAGYRLNLKNDYHIGERVSKMIKLKFRSRHMASSHIVVGMDGKVRSVQGGSAGGSGGATATRPIQSYLLLTSYTGAFSQLLPVDQLIFKRLSALVTHMTHTIRQVAGLNPLAYRLFVPGGFHHPHYAKKLLDATLVFLYPTLAVDEQRRLARAIGTTPAHIIDNIKWIVWSTQMR